MRYFRPAVVLAAVAMLAGCQDDDVLTPSVAENTELSPVTGITDPSKGAVHTGYILGEDSQTPIRIGYQVVNGHAIWDGDIGLGPADQIANTSEAALQQRSQDKLRPSFSLHYNGRSYWSGTPSVIPVRRVFNPTNLTVALNQIEAQVPGVNFVPWNGESHYLVVYYGNGSNYYNGCYNGRCEIYIGRSDASKQLIMHEFGHGLGFQHEQKRCDRNSYIRMNDTRPDPAQFYVECGWVEMGGYDLTSIMHYNSREFGYLHFTDFSGREVCGYWCRTTLSAGDVAAWRRLYPAATTYPVIAGGPYPARWGPHRGYSTAQTLASGTQVKVVCTQRGGSEIGPDGISTNVWNRLGGDHAGKWVSDAHLKTGSFDPVAPPCYTVKALVPTYNNGSRIPQHKGAGTGYATAGSIGDNVSVGVICTQRGGSYTGPDGIATTLWNKLSSGYWVSDAVLKTGTFDPVAPAC